MKDMRKKITYLIVALVISIFMGCAHRVADSIANTNPGSVIVDFSDYNEEEAEKLAETQCAKSKRHAKRTFSPNKNTNRHYHFTCVF